MDIHEWRSFFDPGTKVEPAIGVACPPLPDMVVVEDASDVPCSEADLAKYDLTDPDLNDGDGADLDLARAAYTFLILCS